MEGHSAAAALRSSVTGQPGPQRPFQASPSLRTKQPNRGNSAQRAGPKDPCLSPTPGTFYPPAQSIWLVLGVDRRLQPRPLPKLPLSFHLWRYLGPTVPTQNGSPRWVHMGAPMCVIPCSSLPTSICHPLLPTLLSCPCCLMPCPTQGPSFSQLPEEPLGSHFSGSLVPWCAGSGVQHTIGTIPKSGRMPRSP